MGGGEGELGVVERPRHISGVGTVGQKEVEGMEGERRKTPTGREKGQLIKRRTVKYNWKMLSWGPRSLVQRQEQVADKDNT